MSLPCSVRPSGRVITDHACSGCTPARRNCLLPLPTSTSSLPHCFYDGVVVLDDFPERASRSHRLQLSFHSGFVDVFFLEVYCTSAPSAVLQSHAGCRIIYSVLFSCFPWLQIVYYGNIHVTFMTALEGQWSSSVESEFDLCAQR